MPMSLRLSSCTPERCEIHMRSKTANTYRRYRLETKSDIILNGVFLPGRQITSYLSRIKIKMMMVVVVVMMLLLMMVVVVMMMMMMMLMMMMMMMK